jgi:hypothetical protein
MGKSLGVISTFMWVAGIVLAKGFWWTTFAVLVPLYGWIKVVQLVLAHFGVT